MILGGTVPATPLHLTWPSALAPYITLIWVALVLTNSELPNNLTKEERDHAKSFIKFNIGLLSLMLVLIVGYYFRLFDFQEKRPAWARDI